MHRLLVLIAALVVGLSVVAPAAARIDGAPDQPPPLLPGSREVQYFDSGRIVSTTRIPSGSVLARHGGGKKATCNFIDFDGDAATNPPVAPGTVRPSTRFIFVEGNYAMVPFPVDTATISGAPASKGPISAATRIFSVYCGDGYHGNLLGIIAVGARDPFWNVDGQLATLYDELQLDRPRVVTEPPPGWPGFIVNNPRALAIDAAPWRRYQATRTYRGWNLALIAEPADLAFTVDVRPRPDDTRHRRQVLTTSCPSPAPGFGVVPAPPALPDFATPQQLTTPCTFLPVHRGTASVAATVTYRVTYWVNGYSDAQPDYAWSSAPRAYQLGEIHSVNVVPDP